MKQLSSFLVLAITATVNAQTTHEIHVIDNAFVPPALTIELGDAIHLIFDDDGHTFTQVSQATWMANDNTPLPGGYNYGTDTPNPGNDFTFTPDELGTIYYVCIPHADDGMKGTIMVTGPNIIAEGQDVPRFRTTPNPAQDRITFLEEFSVPVEVEFYDATGRLALTTVPVASSVIDVSSLPAGHYQMLVRDREQRPIGRAFVVVTH